MSHYSESCFCFRNRSCRHIVLLVSHVSDFSISTLQAEKTSHQRIWRLLMLLPKRGPKAFNSFCLALQETEQKHLCDLLTQPPDSDGFETRGEVRLQHLPNRQCVEHTTLVVNKHSHSSLVFSNFRN